MKFSLIKLPPVPNPETLTSPESAAALLKALSLTLESTRELKNTLTPLLIGPPAEARSPYTGIPEDA